MILPFNLKELYENQWLGVQLTHQYPAIVRDEAGKEIFTLNPNQAYLVTYMDLSRNRGIAKIDEENSMVFELDSPDFKFIDVHSKELN